MTQFLRRQLHRVLLISLTLVVVVGILMVWMPYQRELHIARAIEACNGGRARFGYRGPDWLPGSLRSTRLFHRVVSVNLDGEKAVPADLVRDFKELKKLEKLRLVVPISGEHSLDGFHRLTNLSHLHLALTPLSNEDWDEIQNLPLQTLGVNGIGITKHGMRTLGSLTRLQGLHLSETQIDDAELKHINGLTNLESLNLSKTRITGEGLKELQGMTRLRYLNLSGTQVTDAGLEHLLLLKSHLLILDLEGTPISDSGLPHLTKLKVFSLNLKGTRISEAGRESIRQALPDSIVE